MLAPRLDAAGADGSRIGLLRCGASTPSVADIGTLERLLDATEDRAGCPAGLLVVDPLGAFLPPGADANAEGDVRAALQPLRDMAARRGVTVLLVAHLRKGAAADPVHRLSGSQAIGALARSVFGVARDPVTGRRCFGRLKGNLGRWPAVLGYDIVGDAAPSIRWAAAPEPLDEDGFGALFTGELRGSAGAAQPSRRTEAVEWLRGTLATGPMPSGEVERLAEATGIRRRTLDAARKELGIVSERDGSGWIMRLPAAPCAAEALPV